MHPTAWGWSPPASAESKEERHYLGTGLQDRHVGVEVDPAQARHSPGWPTTASAQSLFDPLWGTDDPAAGDWFGQQALQLAQLASPPLPGA
jgi:hypothetical protein